MIWDGHSSAGILLFGVALFMFGMRYVSENLTRLTANRAREVLSKLSDRKFVSVGVGILLTVLMQSSGAVTTMLVGLGAAGVITLREVMGIIIGSAIGSTLTVQLISFQVSKFGLGIFTACFAANFLASSRKIKMVTNVGIGFGLIFMGMEFMSLGARDISQMPVFLEIFKLLNDSPITSIIITAIFTAFVHSSAVVIGFAMSLLNSGAIEMQDAIYWVFGANIGTTATALIASIGGNHVSRQVAWSNTFFKFGAVILFFGFAMPLVDITSWMGGDFSRQIANAHTIFNVVAGIVFLPFLGYAADWIEGFFTPSQKDRPYRTKFIDSNTIETPTLAIAQANREILRMGDVVLSMLKDSIHLFKEEDPELAEYIRERDNKVDLLHTEIKAYLVQIGGDDGLNRDVVRMISFVSELESAADVIEKSIAEMAIKTATLKLKFSEKGWDELNEIHSMTYELGVKSLTCFQTDDIRLSQEVLEMKRFIRKKEVEYRKNHYERLNEGIKESHNTSSIHLDVLSDLRRVSGLLSNHVYELRKQYDSD
ncbi:MAG: Na/Pi cotransporter family protein [Bdellovibrionales bacterium]